MPLISVIVACYNYGKYLSELVASLQKQTLEDFEVIIVDDCSTDNTFDFCADAMLMDKRVKALRLSRNVGKSAANNVGMSISKGQYFTILDADDMRAPESLQKLYEACVNNPHNFSYDDMVLYTNGAVSGKVWVFPEYNFNVLLDHNTIHTGIMFERKAYEDTGGYPAEFSFGREDWAFNILLGTKGYCGIHVNYPGYIYRREGQNRTLTNTDYSSQKKFEDMIREKFSDLYNGRFPMGCCGQRYPVNSQPTASQEVLSLVGSEGMTAVEYIGGNFGTTTFYGPVTGTAYRFDAGQNRKKMVDNRDLSTKDLKGLLDLRDHTRVMFVISQDQPAVPAPSIPEDDEPLAIEEVTISESDLSSIVSPTSATYKKLVASGISSVEELLGYSAEDLSVKAGISKSTAKAVLGAAAK